MSLTLAVVGKKVAQLGGAVRKTFTAGGTIGRLPENDWVLPDDHISGRHARIICSGGKFLIEDTSTNGVFMNSPANRLTKGQRYELQDGDTLYLDDFEVRVSLSEDRGMPEHASDAYPANAHPASSASSGIGSDDPFGMESEHGPNDIADPLKLLGLEGPPKVASGPLAADLDRGSPLQQYYRPPAVPTPAPDIDPFDDPPKVGAPDDDFDPFAEDAAPPVRQAPPPRASPKPRPAEVVPNFGRPTPGPQAPRPGPKTAMIAGGRGPNPELKRVVNRVASSGSMPAAPEPVDRPERLQAQRDPVPRPVVASDPGVSAGTSGLDFHRLLAGAGISSGDISPEVSQQFGEILKVVVEGLMDVLRAREKIKEEFRMRVTTFKPADNNPLKYSANVEDALHNLLVKRNKAYLGPVEAFDDAFRDVRNHQMAMLAGVRLAYEAMLQRFDPDKLQEEFEGRAKGGLFSGLAKQQYWELYRSTFRDMVKDADSSFRRLFGDDFAEAYEEQLARLKAASRAERK